MPLNYIVINFPEFHAMITFNVGAQARSATLGRETRLAK